MPNSRLPFKHWSPKMPHLALARTATGAAALLLSSTFASVPAHAAVGGKELLLAFEGNHLRENTGAASLAVEIATRNGGRLESVSGYPSGTAAAFPAFRTSTPPQAVITVVDRAGADDLSPGLADFRFGADFRLDAGSERSSSSDNGNNLMQRGLFDAAMQYKLQLDGNRPSCRVKGSSGAVSVRSSRTIDDGTWHRATCARQGDRVVLTVIRLSDETRWTYAATGRIGTLRPPSPSVPLSVGGKVNNNGAIRSNDSDQFNGRVDNAFLNIF